MIPVEPGASAMSHMVVAAIFGSFLAQAIIPDLSTYLVPFNTAVMTLMWWRVTQLEKAASHNRLRIEKLSNLVSRMGGRMHEDEEVEGD